MIRTVFLRLAVFLLGLSSVLCPAAAAQQAEGVCLTRLPEGRLMLGQRYLRAGDVLTAEQLSRVTWEGEESITVGYLPVYDGRVAEEVLRTFSLRTKENQPPVAEDSALETYKNLPNTENLKVHDPEGETMTFTLVRQPRRGTVEIGEDGTFTYTPKKNKVGVDSFTYTAADASGKVSREATVTVTILKPSDAASYTDTLGKDCRFAAEWMRHSGIFVGEQVGQEPCFGPEKQVTGGEFLTMLVKTLEIPAEETANAEGFEDAPVWLRPYLAAALRSGLMAGVAMETFGEDAVITGTQAAVMLGNALDSDAFADLTEQPLTRADTAQILYEASKLRQTKKIDTVI